MDGINNAFLATKKLKTITKKANEKNEKIKDKSNKL